MLIVEAMNEAISRTVDSVHIALAEMPYAFDIRTTSPTSGKLIKEPSQGSVGFVRQRHKNPFGSDVQRYTGSGICPRMTD